MTHSDELVERVARAICHHTMATADDEGVPWEAQPKHHQVIFLNAARAALSALPSHELLREALEALEPFSAVAERDIGDDETDSDRYRVMSERNARAPLLCVGHLRRARATAEKIRAELEVG